MRVLSNIKNRFLNITKSPYFNEIYCLILMFIALFSWRYNTLIGLSIMIVLATIILLLTFDFNLILPITINLIFMINEGFSSSSIPIYFVILGVLFFVILFIFIIKNLKYFKWKKMTSFYGLLGLAIMNLIPIFYSNIAWKNNVLYFLYFADLIYLILYLLFACGLVKANIKLLATSFSYLALLLAFESLYGSLEVLNNNPNMSIFSVVFYLGWGICNEAGIMLCFSIPFIYYLMADADKISKLVLQNIKLIIAFLGVILTTSRGSYLCALALFLILSIVLLKVAKLKKTYRIYFTAVLSLIIILFFSFYNYTFKLISDMINIVFSDGLASNGRVTLYKEAMQIFMESPLHMVLGAGICYKTVIGDTMAGIQLKPIIYHSTFFETLVMGGIFGIIMLIIHLIAKYKTTFKLPIIFSLTVGIGFILVDIYGLIDNTYHMYYFMVPFVITLAVLDTYNYSKV